MVRNIIRTVTTLALTGIITFGGFGVSGLNGIDNQPLSAHASQQTNQQVNPDTIGVTIDGVPVVFTDQQPIIVDGRTLVPVRGVFEALGFEVEWMPNWQAVWIKSPTIELIIPVGTYNHFNVNRHDGEGLISNPLDVKAQMINDRTMLPIRLPLEAVGFEVGWDDIGRNVTVTTNGNGGADATIANTTNSNVNNTNVTTASNPDTNADIPHWQLAGFPSQWAYDMFGSGLQGQQSIPPAQQPMQSQPPSQTQPSVTETMTNPTTQGVPSHLDTRSSITLPDRRLTDAERDAWIAEYHALGGANDVELEIIRLINEIRREHGLVELELDADLMMSARFHSQAMTVHGRVSHEVAPYGHSSEVATAFSGRSAAGHATSSSSAIRAVELWMESEPHRDSIMRPGNRFIGVGVCTFSYLFTRGN